MSKAIENLEAAQRRAIAGRPSVGGFPIWPKRCAAQAYHGSFGTCLRARVSI